MIFTELYLTRLKLIDMEATYSSIPEVKKSWKTFLTITVITIGAVLIYSYYIKITEDEKDSNIRAS